MKHFFRQTLVVLIIALPFMIGPARLISLGESAVAWFINPIFASLRH
jgi:hypothetical protein